MDCLHPWANADEGMKNLDFNSLNWDTYTSYHHKLPSDWETCMVYALKQNKSHQLLAQGDLTYRVAFTSQAWLKQSVHGHMLKHLGLKWWEMLEGDRKKVHVGRVLLLKLLTAKTHHLHTQSSKKIYVHLIPNVEVNNISNDEIRDTNTFSFTLCLTPETSVLVVVTKLQ